MTRDEAIEAGARVLDPNAWDDALWRLMGGGTAQEVRQAEARSDVAAVLNAVGWRPEAEHAAAVLREAATAAHYAGLGPDTVKWLRARADALDGAS